MSELINKSLGGLQKIAKTPTAKLKVILKKVTRAIIKAIAEIALNVCSGVIVTHLSKREKSILKSLTLKSVSLLSKRRTVIRNPHLVKKAVSGALKVPSKWLNVWL